jgi:diacylglycerol kinase
LVISVLILSLEALNTAIEYTCNEITKKKLKILKEQKI